MKSMQKIGLLLTMVFLLPALFFSVYEISSLTREEEMIQEVYGKQLEAILFSVNQYSDDVLNSWISKIENSGSEADGKENPEKIRSLMTFNSSLRLVFINDTIGGRPDTRFFTSKNFVDWPVERVNSLLMDGRQKINQLISYKRNGFQKLDVLNSGDDGNLQCLIFVMGDPAGHLKIVGFVTDVETFVQETVGPRLQVIARDQFILSVLKKGITTPIYTTADIDSTTFKTDALTKDLWVFPDYFLGIQIKGSSLHDLTAKRKTTNLVMLLSLDAILILALILVFRNVKKEVQLAQNKSDFISNVSHEIRTPLALISMFAETLEMGRVASDEKRNEYYSIISKETNRLSGIVNRILNFSQAEANKKKFNLVPLHVKNSVDEILKTYDFHLHAKGFKYSLTGDSEDVWVLADKEAFTESVINLIDNAIKYSADKKNIDIEIGRKNDFGYVSVKDEGVGISRMDQKHIFDKFYRVSTGDLAASSRGTGLGLSLVKQLMNAQHGKITVASEPGKGSVFTLYFPLHQKI